jgi:hypothetical protein
LVRLAQSRRPPPQPYRPALRFSARSPWYEKCLFPLS